MAYFFDKIRVLPVAIHEYICGVTYCIDLSDSFSGILIFLSVCYLVTVNVVQIAEFLRFLYNILFGAGNMNESLALRSS